MKEIKGFDGEYSFLSNFDNTMPLRLIPIYVYCNSGKLLRPYSYTFPTAEHAFHAFKVFKNWKHITEEELPQFEKFLEYETPGKAKRAGRKIPLNTEYWDSVKDEVMYYILTWKFGTIPYYRYALLDTGDAYLEETNTWGDKYWGVCNGEGLNRLGKILMKIRREILDASNTTL